MDLITVIVPVYNVEAYLERCLDSILNQSYPYIEIIMVDDGSPDGSGAICDRYAEEHPNMRVIHKENEGLGLTRNAGMRAAKGDYVAFVDSDDWIDPDHLRDLYDALQQHGADVCYAGFTKAFSTGQLTVDNNSVKDAVYTGSSEIVNGILLPMVGSEVHDHEDIRFQASACMALYSMRLIREHSLVFNSERKTIAEDLFFNIEFLSRACAVVFIPRPSYYYYINVASISRRFDTARFERTKSFYRELIRVLSAHGYPESSFINRVRRATLIKIRVLITQIAVSALSHQEKLAAARQILNDSLIVQILSEYPINESPRGVAVVLRLMKQKKANTLLFVLKTKNTMDHSPALHKFLRRIRGLR